jgi:hypothetical protein
MPVIKRLARCQIRINLKDHAPPHFHVLFRDGREVLLSISDLKVLRGQVAHRELSEVLEWAAANRQVLRHKFEEYQK